jgi:hypothetical protein
MPFSRSGGRRWRWPAVTVVAAAALVAAGQQAPSAESVLRRTRERLLDDVERLPRYTCVQTITRRYYRPQSEGSCSALIAAREKRKSKPELRGWDRLRLEVAIVDGDNVYSWVGAPRFESGTLEQLAGRGPLNSGDFGPFLHSIFNLAAVTFKGQEPAGNRRLLSYSYDVPVEHSKYMVKTDAGWTPTAYSGVFVLDPEAGDIVSLTVRTAELPEGNPDCQAISEVDYGRMRIHERMVLIPRETRLVTIDRRGGETQSLTAYAGCREYASKTRMLFDALPTDGATPAAAPAPLPTPLPAGLRFSGRIVTAIDSDTAAAGDPIEAVLRAPIRDKNVELAPAGVHLHGRLVGMEQRTTPLDSFRISIQFESIELKGRAVPLRAAPDSSTIVGVSVFRTPVWVSPGDAAPDVTAITFRKPHLRLEKFDWIWTTLASSGVEKDDSSSAH